MVKLVEGHATLFCDPFLCHRPPCPHLAPLHHRVSYASLPSVDCPQADVDTNKVSLGVGRFEGRERLMIRYVGVIVEFLLSFFPPPLAVCHSVRPVRVFGRSFWLVG